eukprot:GILK01014264.1.p1 GENE.GILK01014264.1~~GILK01014264.1.p1  ORF type:complete len:192 (+),score=26.25 GILK01014264.1:49-576(+)
MSKFRVGLQEDRVTKAQRVRSVVASGLKSTEYKQLSNGNYTCLICNNGSVFNTLQVFRIHRAGKKHQAAVQLKHARYEEHETSKFPARAASVGASASTPASVAQAPLKRPNSDDGVAAPPSKQQRVSSTAPMLDPLVRDKLLRAGWRYRDGSWIKDESVEIDSDDEELRTIQPPE